MIDIDGPRRRRPVLRAALVLVVSIPVAALVEVVVLVLAVRPPVGDFAPATWTPGRGFEVAPASRTTALASAATSRSFPGPEDIAIDADGVIFTGDRTGRIWRIDPEGSSGVFAHVGGRPLGLAFDADGALVVANHGVGLQSVSPGGSVTLLANRAGGAPIRFANDLVISAEGVVYLTDSSSRYHTASLGDTPSYLLPDLIDGRPTGRVISYDLRSTDVDVVLDGLYFPNGIAVTADQRRLWIAESNRYRVLDHTIGGPTRVVADDLPGTPDGINSTSDGQMIIALYDRVVALDQLILPYTLSRQIMIRLPTGVFVNERDPLTGAALVLD